MYSCTIQYKYPVLLVSDVSIQIPALDLLIMRVLLLRVHFLHWQGETYYPGTMQVDTCTV
jgi:hypothetical protein